MTAHPSTTFLLFRPARSLPLAPPPPSAPRPSPSDYDSHLRAVSPRRAGLRKAPDASEEVSGPRKVATKIAESIPTAIVCASVENARARARGLSRDNHTMRTRPGPEMREGDAGGRAASSSGSGGARGEDIYCDRIETPSLGRRCESEEKKERKRVEGESEERARI